jgi:hypothetical protein
MAKMARKAYRRIHTYAFWVSYSPGPHRYTRRRFDSFWEALGFWWGARKNQNYHNVKWEFRNE